MNVDPRQREILQVELGRMQRTLSPKIRSGAKCMILPKWERVRNRYGEDHRVKVFHVFSVDKTREDPKKRARPVWIGRFPFREEAESFATGYLSGKSQVWMGAGLAGVARGFALRAPQGPRTSGRAGAGKVTLEGTRTPPARAPVVRIAG